MSHSTVMVPASSEESNTRPLACDLLLVIHALHGGGSEHTLARMASEWASQGRSVVLLTLADVASDRIALDPRVRRVGLGLMSDSRSLFDAVRATARRVTALRRAIQAAQPQQVLSFVDRMNVLTLLACAGTRWRPVVAERTDPARHRIGGLWDFLRRWTYPTARAVVVQTSRAADTARTFSGMAQVVVIPNCVWPAPPWDRLPACQCDGPPVVVGVGRLSFEKGFDLLLAAFARIAPQFPDWNLLVIGDGPERARLIEQAQQAGLTDRVRWPGWSESPWQLVPTGSVFVLPSRYEGFPNALLEAMSQGLSAVASDCPSGPAEIIDPDVTGLLVPSENVAELAAALARLLSNPPLRAALASAARRTLDPDTITRRHMEQWDQNVVG